MPPPAIFISILLLSLQLTHVSPRELRKLMRQQDEMKFDEDIRTWTQGLEQLGLNMAQFVEQCRQPGSDCQQRSVQLQLRVLQQGYTELKAQLEALEMKYVGRVSDPEAMNVTLRTVKVILGEYDETFKMLKAKTNRLVGQ